MWAQGFGEVDAEDFFFAIDLMGGVIDALLGGVEFGGCDAPVAGCLLEGWDQAELFGGEGGLVVVVDVESAAVLGGDLLFEMLCDFAGVFGGGFVLGAKLSECEAQVGR